MALRNTTGTPKTTDYNLGRGAIYAAPLAANGRPAGYRHLGNAPKFNLTVNTETLEHKASLHGLKVVDRKVTLSQGSNVSFDLDELNAENVALFFSGTVTSPTNAAVAGFTIYEMVLGNETSATDLVLGRWYDIITSAGVRAYDINAADVLIKTTAVSPVTLVLNTDYTLDLVNGRIFIKSTSTAVATAIAGFQGLTVTLTAKAGAKGLDVVNGLTTSSPLFALKFVAENAANADGITEVQIGQISLSGDGDFALIGDDWTTMSFTGTAEVDVDMNTIKVTTVKAS